MFSRKTLFIVGAGASSEAGLPIGNGLAVRIAKLLTFKTQYGQFVEGDGLFAKKLGILLPGKAFNEHMPIAKAIAGGVCSVSSIDRFIDTHRDDPRVATLGKAAIVYEILKSEAQSSLAADRSQSLTGPNLLELETSWYPQFGRILVEGVPKSELANVFENVTIVCFNYDRCIEQFLTYWLISVYGIDYGHARDLVSKLEILHPYGAVAALPATGVVGTEYGATVQYLDLRPLVGNIKTFTEQIVDKSVVEQIRAAVTNAETIVFLGFAFLKQNLDLISPEENCAARRIYGSAFGFSGADTADIDHDLSVRFTRARSSQPHISVHNQLTCAGLFKEYSRTLSK